MNDRLKELREYMVGFIGLANDLSDDELLRLLINSHKSVREQLMFFYDAIRSRSKFQLLLMRIFKIKG